MSRALDLAREGLGRVAPNPSVGCVLVKDDLVIAEARTADGGRPHAESLALELAGPAAMGATAYVTLEPCVGDDHSCSMKLVDAGIIRVVIGCRDENPQIAGKGIDALRRAGLVVKTGCLESECQDLNRGFFLAKTQNRPLVTLKTATSLDSKIATSSGDSRWITGDESRRFVHGLRATHDAILTGIGTVLADDPELTTRIDSFQHESVRIVLDSSLRMSPSARMLKIKISKDILVFANENANAQKESALADAGVTVIRAPQAGDGKIDPGFVLHTLAARGITRLMVEAGQGVLTSFLHSGLWDDLYIMRAPIILGADGRDAFGAMGISKLAAAIRPHLISREALGPDFVERYARVS